MGRRISDLSKEPIDGHFFGNRLKEQRLAIGITIEKLSEIVGVGRNYISQLENGDRVPSFATIIRISNALKTTTDTFFRDYLSVEQKTLIRSKFLDNELIGLTEKQQLHIENQIKEEIAFCKSQD